MTLGNSERKPSVDAVEVKRQIAKRLKIGRASVYRVRRSTEPDLRQLGQRRALRERLTAVDSRSSGSIGESPFPTTPSLRIAHGGETRAW